MPNKLMMLYSAADLLFAGCGGLLLGFALVAESNMRATPTVSNVASTLLLGRCPLTATVVNSIFVLATFILSMPALLLPANRFWLRVHGWLVVFCALFTLCLGLAIWVSTLHTRKGLATLWASKPPQIQSLLQQRFNCCGYNHATSPPFVQDNVCTSTLVAAQKGGCISPFSSFANGYLDLIFTAAFGVVGIDTLLVLCVAMVLKHRQELERYRHIDEKNSLGGL